MGGIGSGRRYRGISRQTVEDCLVIDVRHWQRDGLLTAGRTFQWSWSRNGRPCGSINVHAEIGHVRLSYAVQINGGDRQEINDRVSLDHTACHYGGSRSWFLCPACGNRVAKLYAGGVHYACRRCYRLPYASQQETMADRIARKADKIRERLGGPCGVLNEFPARPKGMHHKTYQRLWWQDTRAREAVLGVMAKKLGMERLVA